MTIKQIKSILKSLKRFDPVYFEWADASATSPHAWFNIDEDLKEKFYPHVKNIAFFIDYSEKFLYCCRAYDSTTKKDSLNFHTIPIGCIISIKKVKP